jgi:hypothetical protein
MVLKSESHHVMNSRVCSLLAQSVPEKNLAEKAMCARMCVREFSVVAVCVCVCVCVCVSKTEKGGRVVC